MPPQELITNRRCTPSTSDQTAGLLESISAGRSIRGAEIEPRRRRARDCACAVAISERDREPQRRASRGLGEASLLEMRDQLLEHLIRRHVGLQRRDRT